MVRTPLSVALEWISASTGLLLPETIRVDEAAGRVTFEPVVGARDVPDADRAAANGYALRAADTEGASDYNPLALALVEAGSRTGLANCASPVASGMALPPGADAILPFDGARRDGAMLEVSAPVARGTGVDRRGCEFRGAAQVAAGSRRLQAPDVAVLLAAGGTHVAVVRRPRVRSIVVGPKNGGADLLTPMLRLLVERDGGTAVAVRPAALADSIARSASDADLILVAGRSGEGLDDDAPSAVMEAGGRLDIHGIAMRPGTTAGLGTVGTVPLVLLPGSPLACLAAYDVLATRAIRRMAGRHGAPPYPVIDAVLGRKVVSEIGSTDFVRVRLAAGRAEPLGSVESGGLFGTVQADGFVVVPEVSEGFAPGSTVQVHLYDQERVEAPA